MGITRLNPLVGVVIGVTAAVVLAGCGGSAISPEKARAMNQAALGAGTGDLPGQGVASDGGTVSDPGGTGATAGTDPGTPGSSGTSDGTTTGTPGSGGTVTVDGPTTGTGVNAPTGTVKAASCTGLKNQTGITDSEITLANVSDVSGPVPGLFASAQDGARAYVAYFNATSRLCGRKLKLVEYDSRTDATGDLTAYEKACDSAFAVIGSASILDAGGAAATQRCGIPDLRSTSLSNERANCTVCYPTQASRTGDLSVGPYRQLRSENKAATDSAAFVYLNTGGTVALAKGHAEIAKSQGWTVKLIQSIDVADFNYGPYVQRLKSLDVKYVYFFGATPQAVRLVRAMDGAGYRPQILQLAQTQFTKEYVDTAGSLADGSLIWVPHQLFTSSNPEIRLYQTWLQQSRPGAAPTSFGVFAWSAMRLFVEKATGLGGQLTRANLVKAVKAEHRWTANGMHTLMDVGGKKSFTCAYLTRLSKGTWKQSPKTPVCGAIRRTSQAE